MRSLRMVLSIVLVCAALLPALAAEGPLVVRITVTPYDPIASTDPSVRGTVTLTNPGAAATVKAAEVQFLDEMKQKLQSEKLEVSALGAGETKALPPFYFLNSGKVRVTVRVHVVYSIGGTAYEKDVDLPWGKWNN